MRKTHINPHKLVDRLEKKYQKKTRFQKYKNLTRHFRTTLFKAHNVSHDDNSADGSSLFDYEYTG